MYYKFFGFSFGCFHIFATRGSCATYGNFQTPAIKEDRGGLLLWKIKSGKI